MGVATSILFGFSSVIFPGIIANLSWQEAIPFLDLAFKAYILVILAIIFLVDLKTGLIPDRITYPAMATVAIYLFLLSSVKSVFFYQELSKSQFGRYLLPPYSGYLWDNLQRIWAIPVSSLLSAAGGAAIFALLIILTRGRGMGWGDVKYIFFLGLALGLPNIIVAVFFAFALGAAVSLFLMVLRRKHFGQTIPFAPFLSTGGYLALLWGPSVIKWYLESFLR